MIKDLLKGKNPGASSLLGAFQVEKKVVVRAGGFAPDFFPPFRHRWPDHVMMSSDAPKTIRGGGVGGNRWGRDGNENDK